MAYKTMTFSRSSNGYNAEDGDYLDFTSSGSLSFGSLYKCTDFTISITGGITSATTSGRDHEINVELCFGSTWRRIWSGAKYLPARGTTGYTISFTGTIPEAYQAEAAANGITGIRLQQSGDFALRGANASGTAEITYVDYVTNCGAPTSVLINGSASNTTGYTDKAILSWSGAKGGINNPIARYELFYQDSTNGVNWSGWYEYKDVSSTASSGSVEVDLGSVGTYRVFSIATIGSAGESYGSSTASSPAIQRVNRTACTAPTNVSLAATGSTGENVRLSWSGASAGVGNSIAGYEVQRRESADGSNWTSWSSLGTTTSTYTNVAPPTTAGNYYQYQVRTLGSAGASYNSDWKISSNTLRRSYTPCGAPTSCAVDSTLSLVATMLRWSGATAGYGNTISKYEVQRRSKAPGGSWSAWSAFEITSGTSLSVSPPATAGHYYQYRVRAQGTAGEAYYSGWKESTNTLRKAHKSIPAFTDPTLIVGQTDVKAVHITELQNAMNDILLPFMGVSTASFTELERDSDAKHWGNHVQEIKTAIDSTGVSHDSWVAMQDEVTADVIEQLRRIVKSM
mgnify:CR=1 FL=1